MKQPHQSVALAGLLAVVLAISGCASMRGAGDTSSGASGTSGTSGASGSSGIYDSATSTGTDAVGIATGSAITSGSSGTAGSSGSSGASGSGTSSMHDDRGNQAPAAAPVPNSTVLAIEILPVTGGVSEGDSSMGSSGTSGAVGSSGAGQPYRVTVRMDDGSTQVVNHDTTPDFRSGDRINVTSGAIRR